MIKLRWNGNKSINQTSSEDLEPEIEMEFFLALSSIVI
jgi:hypothetical protein